MADRYCSNCGQELNEDTRFCPNCGRPVHQTAHVPTPEADVPVPPPPVTQQFDTATQDGAEERTSSGFGRMRGAWDWFLARPVRTKVLLVFAVLVVAIVLSPLWEVVARLALLVSIVALIWCLMRRRPASTWGIAVVVTFVSMYGFGGVSNALYSETSEQTKPSGAAPSERANAAQPKREAAGEVESVTEEAAQKDAEEKDAGADAKSSDGKATAVKEEPDSNPDTDSAQKPGSDGEENGSPGQAPPVKTPPPTVEEQLYAKIAGVFLLERKPVKEMAEQVKGQEFRPSQADGLKQVDIIPQSQGCRYVNVEFYEQEAEFMEFNMEEVYRSVYKNEELSQSVCNVQVSAFQELQDKYGQTFSRRVYVTSMDKATASKVGDWLMVEQPAIWTVNKMHPVVEAELAQNAVEHAADCAEDEGIFDMQPLECP